MAINLHSNVMYLVAAQLREGADGLHCVLIDTGRLCMC